MCGRGGWPGQLRGLGLVLWLVSQLAVGQVIEIPPVVPPPVLPPPAEQPAVFPPPAVQPPVFPPGTVQPAQAPVVPTFQPAFQPAFPPGSKSGPSMREVFAATLATVAQASGGAIIGGVAGILTGRLMDWFSQKLAPKPPTAAMTTPAQVQGGFAPPEPPQAGAGASFQPATAMPLVAGVAFEVHRLGPAGDLQLVDPETHEFRTGERFVLLYRPSLPGRVHVYNINPAGQQTLIDSQDLAGGQLQRLGPYEFTAMTGDEQLRLVMSPCSTPALVTATRDIVRVADTDGATGIALPACETLVTRSARTIATRDIRKVSVEDGTSFAVDPLSAAELSTGEVAPREVTIRFRHR